jgi:hypothetical protein
MNESNNYAAPESDLVTRGHGSGRFEVHEPVGVSIAHGLRWLSEAFIYFKRSPGPWVLTCIFGFVILVVLSFIPFVNMLISLTTYIWIGGILMGCKAQHEGEKFDVKYLFRGFQEKLGELLGLGAVMFVANILLIAVSFGSFLPQMMGIGGDFKQLVNEYGLAVFGVPIFVYLALLIPIIMMSWFAPALICLGNVRIFKAMRMSFLGCLKNVLPMTFYSLVLMVAMIIASIPLLLGWLILVPVTYASFFTSFLDIYTSPEK